MFQKILYPTDFSDTSKKALEYLLRLREAGAREVVIVHVVDTRSLHIPEVYSWTFPGWEKSRKSPHGRRRTE